MKYLLFVVTVFATLNLYAQDEGQAQQTARVRLAKIKLYNTASIYFLEQDHQFDNYYDGISDFTPLQPSMAISLMNRQGNLHEIELSS